MGVRTRSRTRWPAAYRRERVGEGSDPRSARRAHWLASGSREAQASRLRRDPRRSGAGGRARPVYSARVISALELCWRVARAPAGKRLAPMLPVLVPFLRRDGELDLSDAEAECSADERGDDRPAA